MSAAEYGACGVCEADSVQLTTRRKLFKHDTPAGETCAGSGGDPVAAVGELVDEQPPEADGDDWPDDDEQNPPAPGEPPAPAGPVPPASYADPPVGQPEQKPEPPAAADPGQPVYEWLLTISQPALYLSDAAWHQANALAAGAAAVHAGHTPLAEAKCSGVVSTEDGAGLVLTYTVPITEGGPRG